MNNYLGKSFVVVMVIIAVSALLLRIAIDRAIAFTITQNESIASASLKLISVALENYANDNQEVYPETFLALTKNEPSYLDKNYVADSPIKGYNYGCSRLEASGYSCHAVPVVCKVTGEMVFTITSGGLLVSEECEGKE